MNPLPDRSLEEPEERGETAVCENCERRVPVDEIRTVRGWCGETSQCEDCRGGRELRAIAENRRRNDCQIK